MMDTTITVRYGYCPEHAARHIVDEHENHIANDQAEMRARGYFYLRHIGGGWFRWRKPAHEIELPPDWEMMHEARHLLDDDIDF
jgi:hypothetical protein